jgi:hypothetical protein
VSSGIARGRSAVAGSGEGAGDLDLAGDGVHHAVEEPVDVLLRSGVAGRLDGLAERHRERRPPGRPPVEARPRPPVLRPPDPDGDHGRPGRERDPRHTGLRDLELGPRVDLPLREDPGDRAAPDGLDRPVERRDVAGPAVHRDLAEAPERPAEPPMLEELRGDEEPGHAPASLAHGEPEDHPVERAHMVAGHDAPRVSRHPRDARVPQSEAEPEPQADEHHADAPQEASLVAAGAHARMLSDPRIAPAAGAARAPR